MHSAEPSGVWLLSGTNVSCGTPIWRDGNDLPRMPNGELSSIVQRGEALLSLKLCGGSAARSP